MNLSEFLSERLVQAFGWTILHSLWQGALIAILLGLLMIVMRSYSSNARYFVSVSALVTIFLLAVVTFITYHNGYQEPTQTALTFALPSTLPAEAESVERATITWQTLWTSSESYFREHLPLLVSVWLLGMMLLLLRFIGGYAYLQRLKTYQVLEVNNYWNGTLAYLASEIGIKQKVRLLESALAEMPMLIGWLKPVILLPLGTLSGLTIAQVESILAHELAHLKRRDYLVNIFQSILEIILFYNPFIWWVSGYIREERENCCDDIAVSVTGDSLTLVKTLTMLEELRLARPQLAMGFAGRKKAGLLTRVRRLLSRKPQASGFSEGFLSAMVLVFCFSITTVNAYTPYNWHNLRTFAHKSWEKIQEVASSLTGKSGNIEILSGEPAKAYLPTPASEPRLFNLKPLRPLGINDTIRFGKGIMGITDRKGGIKMYKDGKEIPKEDFEKYKEDFSIVQTPKKSYDTHGYIYAPYDNNAYSFSIPNMPNIPAMPAIPPIPPIPPIYIDGGQIRGRAYAPYNSDEVIIIDGKRLNRKEKQQLKKGKKAIIINPQGQNIERDWEQWGEAVGKRMEKWGEQFGKQGDKWEQWGKQMEQWGEQYGKQWENWAENFESLSEKEREEIEKAAKRISELDEKIRDLKGKEREEAEREREAAREARREIIEAQRELQEQARELQEEARERIVEAQREKHLKAFEEKFAPVKDALIQDGLMEKDAKSFKIEADKDGIKINGKKLTPEQEAKYRPLFQKHLGLSTGKGNWNWSWHWED